ncbi:MAG TPA: DUF3471 domain-containing protein [Pseudoxanthomonas sp.]|nr:DUF3471 domain-containing protein [Pseudoxanthomonas sp.]
MNKSRWLSWCVASILACAGAPALTADEGAQAEVAGMQDVPVSEATLDGYAGTYVLQEGTEVRVWREGGRLMLQAEGQAAWPLIAESEAVFRVESMAARISFGLDATGQGDHIVLRIDGRETRGVRR